MAKNKIIVSGYAYPAIDSEVLNNWLPYLTFLDLFSYGITVSGGLIQLDDSRLIETAESAGVRTLMVVTPLDETGMFNDVIASELLESPEARTKLVENITVNIQEKNLDGVDFDFEYIPEKNKEQYVALVQEAKTVLSPLGYYVTVALAPKTSADQEGLLYRGHDYAAMGKIADYILLMTYEWGYTYGPPMAVSPVNQVRRVLDYGVSEIEPSKILMGMPNYGYDWTLPFIQGQSRAENITNEEGAARALRNDSAVNYDELAQAPNYNYTDSQGREHEVWFEDERSIRAQLELIEQYGLAGAAYWNIMNFNPVNAAVLGEMYEIIKL